MRATKYPIYWITLHASSPPPESNLESTTARIHWYDFLFHYKM